MLGGHLFLPVEGNPTSKIHPQQFPATSPLGHSRPMWPISLVSSCPLRSEAKANSEHQIDRLFWVDGTPPDVIEAFKPEPWIVRYEFSDFEWAAPIHRASN
jgi:hypothetical protein